MTKNALILFLKYPEHGAVKTRLTRLLGQDAAFELYRCFLADISAMTSQVHAQTIIVYSGPKGASFEHFPGIPCLPQRGDDLGERMFNALLDVFARGFKRCVLMGSDIPDLPAAVVNDAIEKLDASGAVLGPSTDGGYYLIGFQNKRLQRSIFSDIAWSTSNVFSETLARMGKAGLDCAQLPSWSDIDEVDDLKHFYEKNRSRAATSQVMIFLKTRRIIEGLS